MSTILRIVLVSATVAFFIVVGGGMVTAGSAAAQNYPAKPIRLIVPSAPGGNPDISGRLLASELSLLMGQQVVVENRPGASGIVGFETLASAAPDGYTFGMITFVFATNPSMFSKLPYDSSKDFQPIVLHSTGPNILTVSPSLPIRTVKELIEQARAKPAALSFGSSGIGSSMHLSMELLKVTTGTNLVHVAYKGIQQAISDVIGGQIHIVCDNVGSILPHVNSGRVRALGVTSLKRVPVVPEVPTIDEAGLPGFEITPWGGYSFPARVPRDMFMRMNTEINKVLLLPSVSKGIAEQGGTARGGTPEQFADFLRKETEKWGNVIRAAGVRPQ
jgi:tripartite-type tricarboxylate transporter receptor subunit TctC